MRVSAYLKVLLLVASPWSWAQSPMFGSDWAQGVLVQTSGDTLRGALRFDLSNNMVQVLLADNTVKTFAARQIQWMQAYDPVHMADRRYVSMSYALRGNYAVPVLFELLTEGSVTLLGRERLVVGQRAFLDMRITDQFPIFDFYFAYDNGRIQAYKKNRKALEKLLPDPSGQLWQFVQRNDLRLDNAPDLIRIVTHYNYINRQ